jgi:hypothetical protein
MTIRFKLRAEVQHQAGLESWQVILNVWNGNHCVLSTNLNDGRHNMAWHLEVAYEIAKRINREKTP